ncbi:MAG TPA: helix-turn-helix transcriptional regulator [Trebonia sp.]|nr:helix-turn-helix transcriptional regulator [Trebonia sp.]
MADASPTVRQRELGLRLRKIRTELSLTVEDVAAKLMCSAAKVSRMETGARRPVPRDVRDLCELYNLDAATSAELMNLTRQAREQGWWARYDDLDLYPYIGLEQSASSITHYSMSWVHALLQTEDYAREIIRAIVPQISPAVHQQRVEARLRRQDLLDGEAPPQYRVFLDELVLRRPVGSSGVMAAQIEKILRVAADGKVTVQVIPFDSGAYPAADVMFTLLEFSQQLLRPVVFVEGLASHQYYEHASDIARYRQAIDYIRDCALSPRDSVRLLGQVREAYESG